MWKPCFSERERSGKHHLLECTLDPNANAKLFLHYLPAKRKRSGSVGITPLLFSLLLLIRKQYQKQNGWTRKTNMDSPDIENEPIRMDKCRKQTVYGMVKRKHRPVRSCPIIQQTRHEYIKMHRQMTVDSHNHSPQLTSRHLNIEHLTNSQPRLPT